MSKNQNQQPVSNSNNPKTGPVVIAVIQGGWVKVGRLVEDVDLPDYVCLKNAKCVRKWGTTRGLSQIANDGPTNETILDDTADVYIPITSLIMNIACVQAKWASIIAP
jgi:hypothetical protein